MYGAIANRWYEGQQVGELEVGMGATEMMYSDRRAYTVQKIISDKRIVVTRDKVTRIDRNGPSEDQKYEYESTPLWEGERAERCCNEFVEMLGKDACKHYSANGTCKGCEYFKKCRPTNGVLLIKTKRGWKRMGGSTYFLVGVREEYFDYTF